MVAGANLVLKVFADICRRHRGRTAACERRPDSWHGTGGAGGRRRACVRWAGRERECTQRRVHGLWHHLRAFGWRAGVQHARSRAWIAFFGPIPARHHTRKAGTVSAKVVHLYFGQEPKADIHFEGPCDCILIRHIYIRVAPRRESAPYFVGPSCVFLCLCLCVFVCVLSSRFLVGRTSHLCVCRVGTPPAR